MSALTSDVRAALRAIVRAPLVPAIVVALTTLGIGLTLGMWAIVDAAFLRPLPLPDPAALAVVWETHPQRGRMAVAVANFLDWTPRLDAFAAVGGQEGIDTTLGSGSAAVRLPGARVTPSYFDVWQLPALRGRVFDGEDFRTGQRVALVSARVWRQIFNGAETLVGSTVRIDGAPYTVIGIMPPAASVVGRLDVWVPWVFNERQQTERRFHEAGVFARLRPGATMAQASAALAREYDTLAQAHPETTREWSAVAQPLREVLVNVPTRAVALLVGAVVATFAVTVANIAGLLAGWWPRRRREFETRRALGAGTLAIVRPLIFEGVGLSLTGMALGLGFAQLFVRAFGTTVAPSTPWFAVEPAIDRRAALAAPALLGVVIVTGLVMPAWRAAASTALAPRRSRVSGATTSTIAVQVATALVLLVSAATLLTAVSRLQALVPQHGVERLAIEISLADERYPTDDATRTFFARLIAALKAQPDVAEVGATSYVPPTPALGNMRFTIDGRPSSADERSASPAAVDGAAFRMLGLRVVRGRLFDDRDTGQAPHTVVISESLARRHWGDADPVDSTMRFVGLGAPFTVIGVVSDVRQPLSDDPRAETVLYFDYEQVPWPFMTMLLTPRGAPETAVAALRRVLADLDPDQATGPVQPLVDLQAAWTASPRAQSTLVTLFGLSTLLLTLAGIYARVSYAVTDRRRECAIRAAIGATPWRITWHLTSHVALATLVGLAAGAAMLPIVATALERATVAGSIVDATTIAAGVGLVGLASLAACYLPARLVRVQNLAHVLKAD